jgi:AcrR family transcriptional regulator
VTATPTPYRVAQSAAEAAVRTAILDVAGGILEELGPDALSMRTVASEAGCSTMVVYRLFRSKRGLIAALYREGFARLGARLHEAASPAAPLERLAALGRAYRESALANRTYYRIMFDRPVPGFTPTADERAEAEAALAVLEAAVADALRSGLLGGAPAATIARALWAGVHGAVSLELAGHLDGQEADAAFAAASRGVALAFRPGDDHG